MIQDMSWSPGLFRADREEQNQKREKNIKPNIAWLLLQDSLVIRTWRKERKEQLQQEFLNKFYSVLWLRQQPKKKEEKLPSVSLKEFKHQDGKRQEWSNLIMEFNY